VVIQGAVVIVSKAAASHRCSIKICGSIGPSLWKDQS